MDAFVTPACLLTGVLFPDIAKHGVPYVTYAFAFMTFIGALKSRFRDVADVFSGRSSDLMLRDPSCAGTGGRLRSGTSSVPGQYELYHRNGAGIFRTCSSDQSDVGIHFIMETVHCHFRWL